MSRGPEKQFDRDAVLERAMEVFWQRGYEATGMSTLLEEMGIGRQSLYDTFGDKRSLYVEALAHYVHKRIGPFVATLSAPGSPMANIGRLMDGWVELSTDPTCRGCMLGNSFAEFGSADADMAEILRGYMKTLEDLLVQTLKRAKDAGELDSDLQPRDLARMIVNTGQGLALLSKINPDRARARSVVRATWALLGQP